MTEEEFEAQLQWAMNYADSYGGRATVTLDFLCEVEKRNAKLAAVPVGALAFCVDAASYTYDAMVGEAKAWIATQVTP